MNKILDLFGISIPQLVIYGILSLSIIGLIGYSKHVYDSYIESKVKIASLENTLNTIKTDLKKNIKINENQKKIIDENSKNIELFDQKTKELEAELDKRKEPNNICIERDIAKRLRDL